VIELAILIAALAAIATILVYTELRGRDRKGSEDPCDPAENARPHGSVNVLDDHRK
jgi:hypothetical protein